MRVGVYAGYEQLFGRLSFYAHVGVYLTTPREDVQTAYQRVGTIYRFSKHWYTDIALRFYQYGTGDFVEWSVGYRLLSLPFRR
jgi:hypothetical protein